MTPLTELLRRHVEQGTIPGAVALLGADEPEIVCLGVAAPDGRPLREDSIVRIQSMTKLITAIAALRLVEAGRLELDRSVVEWLPELADRRVLRTPAAELDDTVPAQREITLRHLLTNTAGWGMILSPSPLQAAMAANGTEAGPEPVSPGADEWLALLAELPLAFQPGEGWRYHHSFAVLGILLSRVAGRPLADHLLDDLFGPLGMSDTGFWAPPDKLDRLAAAYRHGEHGLVETEPAGGSYYAGPPFDVSHGELVSTLGDYRRVIRLIQQGGSWNGIQLLAPDHVRLLTSDQVPAAAKQPDSFFPGFWDEMGWGFGVGVSTSGARRGRWGWSGGQGTNFWVDPDGTVGILLTQVEIDDDLGQLFDAFQALYPARAAF
ncbi:serine hydrolase domain-containing protein [Microlunatus ginsengisoli]|uniref:Serine hydrolase n=1 Tax=Microlunatus ginsengisoli TaxID=363863 RepID=A0ABP6ZWE0_9ACTN